MSNTIDSIKREAADFTVGDVVMTTTGIWDDGEDHHAPHWLAMKDQELIVREVRDNCLAVSHEWITDNAFLVDPDEIRPA